MRRNDQQNERRNHRQWPFGLVDALLGDAEFEPAEPPAPSQITAPPLPVSTLSESDRSADLEATMPAESQQHMSTEPGPTDHARVHRPAPRTPEATALSQSGRLEYPPARRQPLDRVLKQRLAHLARIALKSTAAVVDPISGPLLGPRILIYHQVGVQLGREMEVSTETLVRHLDWMQTNGEIIGLAAAIEGRSHANANAQYVLTFDDGFADVYHNAFPLLQRRGLPFTLYLTTAPIETGVPIDLRHPQARPLTWDQVNEMLASDLATIGAHTHTHLDLTSASKGQIAQELDTSNDLIEERTGLTPRHFAYPWGWWVEAAEPLIRDRYDTATLGSGPGIAGSSNPLRLHRLPVQASDGYWLFVARMRGGLRMEDRLRRLVRGYSGV